MKNKEEIILKREDRLLKNEKSWRRARIGAISIFIIFLVVILVAFSGDDLISKNEKDKAIDVVLGWCIFWMVIIDFLILRIQYIDSINLYRKKNCTKEKV